MYYFQTSNLDYILLLIVKYSIAHLTYVEQVPSQMDKGFYISDTTDKGKRKLQTTDYVN